MADTATVDTKTNTEASTDTKTEDTKTADTTDAAKTEDKTETKTEVKTEDKTKSEDVKKAEDGTEAAKDKDAKVVPEKYDLKLPEGSPLKADAIDKIAAIAKERGLSNEEAQAELNKESELIGTYVKGQAVEADTVKEGWIAEAKSDKEIGGDNFAKSAETAKRVVKRFGTEAFEKALNETGLGNHPEAVRVFTRIGKAMSEDQLVLPGTQPAPRKSLEETLYGDTSKKET